MIMAKFLLSISDLKRFAAMSQSTVHSPQSTIKVPQRAVESRFPTVHSALRTVAFCSPTVDSSATTNRDLPLHGASAPLTFNLQLSTFNCS